MDRYEKYCVLIPAFHEVGRIGGTVRNVLKYCSNVIVVDDGSEDGTNTEAEEAGARVITHEKNMGKGVALETGFAFARENGHECVLTLDGDGQHAAEDIPAFFDAYEKTGCSVIIGSRMDDPKGMPFVRRMTNRFMSWLLSRQMGQRVPDTQSGYRLYSCDVPFEGLVTSARFAAESEILLALADKGIQMGHVPIQVIYSDEKSKINPVVDTWRFFSMLQQYKKRQRAEKTEQRQNG